MKSKRNKLSWSIRVLVVVVSLGVTATASASCRTDALSCAGVSAGMLLACSTAAAGLGAVPVNDYACYVAAVGVGGTCTAMTESCSTDDTARNPLTTSGGSTGLRTLDKESYTCGNISGGGADYENRVTGIYAKKMLWSGTDQYLVSSIKMQCAKGSKVFVGNDGVDGATWNGGTCANGRMVQGLSFRAGSFVDAIGRICDYVGYSANDSDNNVITPYGDTNGGNPVNKLCPEGKYLYGMNVWHDNTLPLSKRFVRGVELLCRGY
jgi:hypothetical protein